MDALSDTATVTAPRPPLLKRLIAAFGVVTAGGVVVPVNTRFKAEEAADVITRSGAKAVMIQNGFLGQDFTVPAGVPAIEITSDFLESGRPYEAPGLQGTDIADIIYTSGTTGRAKGVMMNHEQTRRARPRRHHLRADHRDARHAVSAVAVAHR